jgi:hypothetical protein
MTDVKLADAIRDLRAELLKAVAEGRNSDLRFGLGPIELELQVVASAKVGAKGGVDWWIFKAETSGDASQHHTHKLKLTLQPEDRYGRNIRAGRDRDRSHRQA